MRYMGSKAKLAKYILPIMLQDRKSNQWYIEPFAGAMNSICKVDGGLRIANDINPYLIDLYRAVRDGWNPPEKISRDMYRDIKENKDKYPMYLVGFVGFGCSFGGIWFGGYASGEGRNYCYESRRNVLNQADGLRELILLCADYKQLVFPKSSIIYCDPPYMGTSRYRALGEYDEFDHKIFWKWARKLHYSGHRIYVSEYTAPSDFCCVWQKNYKIKLNKDIVIERVEKLFTL